MVGPLAATKSVPLALPVPIRIDTGGASGTRKLVRKTRFTGLLYRGRKNRGLAPNAIYFGLLAATR